MLTYFGKNVTPNVLFKFKNKNDDLLYLSESKYSYDLISWKPYNYENNNVHAFYEILKFKDKFIGFSFDTIMVSNDLINWKYPTFIKNLSEEDSFQYMGESKSFEFNGTLYSIFDVYTPNDAIFGIWKSEDGDNWESMGIYAQVMFLVNGRVYKVGGEVLYSDDMLTWKKPNNLYDFYSDIRYVSRSDGYGLYYACGNEYKFSDNGIDFISMEIDSISNSLDIVNNGEFFITITDQDRGYKNKIAYSMNGVDWEYYTVPFNDDLHKIFVHDGITIIAGRYGLYTIPQYGHPMNIIRSLNWGVTELGWTESLCHDGNRFISTHDGEIANQVMTSFNGYDWEQLTADSYVGNITVKNNL